MFLLLYQHICLTVSWPCIDLFANCFISPYYFFFFLCLLATLLSPLKLVSISQLFWWSHCCALLSLVNSSSPILFLVMLAIFDLLNSMLFHCPLTPEEVGSVAHVHVGNCKMTLGIDIIPNNTCKWKAFSLCAHSCYYYQLQGCQRGYKWVHQLNSFRLLL